MPLPNIHLNNGNYPQRGKEIKNVSTIIDIHVRCISQVYPDNPKQSINLVCCGAPNSYTLSYTTCILDCQK